MNDREKQIQEKFISVGFDLVGFSRAIVPESDKSNIQSWISEKLYGEMEWYPRSQFIRLEFQNLGFQPVSIIALAKLYNTKDYSSVLEKHSFRFSRYAVGRDYHNLLKVLAKPVLNDLKKLFPAYHFRQGVDSLPIPEKVLAREAGLGWTGKNTNLINPQFGSYFFLSIILTDLELEVHPTISVDRCGSCTACLDACPTGALFEPYKIDAGKCISHHTIEDRTAEFSSDTKLKLNGWIYGCDICQEVCPWNQKAERLDRFSQDEAFKPDSIFHLSTKNFLQIDENEFVEWQKRGALSRISYKMFQRNKDAL